MQLWIFLFIFLILQTKQPYPATETAWIASELTIILLVLKYILINDLCQQGRLFQALWKTKSK